MSELRWILLGLGVAFCLGLWWWESRRRGRTSEREQQEAVLQETDWSAFEVPGRRREPSFRDSSRLMDSESEAGSSDESHVRYGSALETDPGLPPERSAPESDVPGTDGSDSQAAAISESESNDESAPGPEQIVSLQLLALADAPFPGHVLRAALLSEALEHGKFAIFHRAGPDGELLFSVASLLEPGRFDLARMDNETFRGVMIFALASTAGEAGLTEMRRTARALARRLNGTLSAES